MNYDQVCLKAEVIEQKDHALLFFNDRFQVYEVHDEKLSLIDFPILEVLSKIHKAVWDLR